MKASAEPDNSDRPAAGAAQDVNAIKKLPGGDSKPAEGTVKARSDRRRDGGQPGKKKAE